MFKNTNTLLRTLTLAALVSITGWWTLFLRAKLGESAEVLLQKEAQIAEQAQVIAELELSLALLKVDHRVARIEVLSQGPHPDDPERVLTRARFRELDPDGQSLGEGRELEVEGTRLYIEAEVIKFDDGYVEAGDFLRGTSVCLFRRAFGADQKPSEGTPLDAAGLRPLPYAGDDLPPEFYLELWERFWEYANDPALAREQGVRSIGGEAPYMELRPGGRYRVELRASGGLSIQAE